MERHAQSLSDTTKSQLRHLEIHSEQRPEDMSIRHSDCEDSQCEQGVVITTPQLETREANLTRRTEDEGTLRGIVSKRHKYQHEEEENHLRSLYPQDNKQGTCYGNRDKIDETGTKCDSIGDEGSGCCNSTEQGIASPRHVM